MRNKPIFYRQDWYKKSRLGRRKKKRKWRAATGIHSKIRMSVKGHPRRPKIGWGNQSDLKGKIKGKMPIRVENLKQLENVKKGEVIIIGKIGKRKRNEIINKAKEKEIIILNKYYEKKNATN